MGQFETATHASRRYGDRKRKDGSLLSEHASRVAYKFNGNSRLFNAAYLHDILEDTDTTVQGLYSDGFDRRTIDLVIRLTRFPKESYLDYILQIAEDPDAVKIKMADIEDNLNGAKGTLKAKYEMARFILKKHSAPIPMEVRC